MPRLSERYGTKQPTFTMRWLTASTSSEVASDGYASFMVRVHCDTISHIEQFTVLSRHVDTSGKISDLRDLGQCMPGWTGLASS